MAQHTPESAMDRRTSALALMNYRLALEIADHKRAEGSLHGAYAEMSQLKDRLQAENVYLQQQLARAGNFGEIIGRSTAMLQIASRAEQMGALAAAVLLRGEPGTGKETVAHAIHNDSARRDRPMITVRLASLPANLMECELFGWDRAECNGTEARQIGRLELADGGSIFLDEVACLTPELQGKLLRLLQHGEMERLGNPRTVKIDVRVIAASSRDLEEAVRDGRFREELFCLLKVFTITVPPLRRRKEDIPLLVDYFIGKYRGTGQKVAAVSGDTLDALSKYHWPGNVRELECLVEGALCAGQVGELKLTTNHFG